MNKFKELPYAGIDEFDFVGFSLVKVSSIFHVDIYLLSDGQKNGVILSCGIHGESIQEVGNKIKLLLSSGVFEHLAIATNAICYNEYGEPEYEFDFEDYVDLLTYDVVEDKPTIN